MTEIDTRPLHTRFRPTKFNEVIGQDHIVASLKAQVNAPDRPHSFMFIGPPGTAKTTLALILAKELGCEEFGLEVVNAPNEGNIEKIRDLVSRADALPMEGEVKVIIIDEIHSLSKQAWSALLDPTEDTPSHVYWIFCSTEEPKVPLPSKTRLLIYRLNGIEEGLLKVYTATIAKKAEIELVPGALDVIVKNSHGSVRQALVHLQAVRGLKTLLDVEKIIYNKISTGGSNDSSTERLGKLLLSGCTDWERYRNILWNVVKEEPTSVRVTLLKMISYELQNSGNESFRKLMVLLDCVSKLPEDPMPYSHLADLQLMIGRVIVSLR